MRDKFFARNQQEREGLDSCVTLLSTLVSTCTFGELEDSVIRDKIVNGKLDPQLHGHLL